MPALSAVHIVMSTISESPAAAQMGNVEEVKRQLAWGVDPNVRILRHRNTALYGTVACGRVEVLKLSLEKGADPTLEFHQWPISEEFLHAVRRSDATEKR